MTKNLFARLCAALLTLVFTAAAVRAEVSELRVSRGYGILYLPLFIMDHEKLIEKHAKAAGLGDIKVSWPKFDGGNVINDAMLSGNLDIAAIGVPGFLVLWSRTKGSRLEFMGLSGLSATSLYLNTSNPNIKSLHDYTEKDKIALPGIKTSLSAVVLQMMVAKEFGPENFAKLDPLTVGLPHPDAYAALRSGNAQVTSHLGSPPFSILELDDPKVHRVVNSVDVLGNISLDMVFTSRRFYEANPKLSAAFVAALDEANALIAGNKQKAAEIYVDTAKIKVAVPEIVRMLEDKDTRFSSTPDGVMEFAEFLSRTNTIKQKPSDWKEFFLPIMHDRKGS